MVRQRIGNIDIGTAVVAQAGQSADLAGHHVEVIRVEPMVDGLTRRLACAEPVWPDWAVECVQTVVLRDAERQTSVDRPDTICLPAAKD